LRERTSGHEVRDEVDDPLLDAGDQFVGEGAEFEKYVGRRLVTAVSATAASGTENFSAGMSSSAVMSTSGKVVSGPFPGVDESVVTTRGRTVLPLAAVAAAFAAAGAVRTR
jgi:hypothetical protein